MPYPSDPRKTTSFTAIERTLGDGSFPGQELDVDFDTVFRFQRDLLAFLKQTLRSDGRLNTAIVGRENLAPDISLGFDAPTTWEPGRDYRVASTVFRGAAFYISVEAHRASETFTDDLTAGRWQLLVNLAQAGSLAAGNNLSDLEDPAEARTNLGGTAIGKALFTALSAASARGSLGLGDLATLNRRDVGIPIGAEIFWTGTTLPYGYLEEDGGTYLRADYPELWDHAAGSGMIGSDPGMFGPGDGSTTFTLPDARGEAFRGWDHGRGVDAGRALGSSQGDSIRSHTHWVDPPSTTTNTTGAHTHTISTNSGDSTGQESFITQKPDGVEYTKQTESAGDHNHTVDIAGFNSGSTGGSETRPRNVSRMVLIRAYY